MTDAIDPEMKAFADSLRSLNPAGAGMNADDLIFSAGKRSASDRHRRSVRRWAFGNAITVAVCLSLGAALWSEQVRRFAVQSELVQAKEQIRTLEIAWKPKSSERYFANFETSASPLLRHAVQLRQALAEGPEAVFSNAPPRGEESAPRPIPTSRSAADFFGI